MMAEKAAGSAAVKSHVSIRTMIYLRPRNYDDHHDDDCDYDDVDDQNSIRTMIYLRPGNYDDDYDEGDFEESRYYALTCISSNKGPLKS